MIECQHWLFIENNIFIFGAMTLSQLQPQHNKNETFPSSQKCVKLSFSMFYIFLKIFIINPPKCFRFVCVLHTKFE